MADTNTSNYLCIGCPMGCRLEVEDDGDPNNIVEIRGNHCRRGEKFVRQEHIDPRRMVTTTVRVEGGVWAKLPVKSRSDVPKDMVVPICDALHELTLTAPVKMGDVVLENALDTGVDIIASRDMDVDTDA